MPVTPCPVPCPPITRGIVTFDDAEFVAAWPEFTGIASAAAQNQFNLAQLILNNTCKSVIQDANERMTLLYLLTAHLVFLNCGTNDGAGNVTPPYSVVGRIASATEGTVTAGVEYSSQVSESEAFFIQTKYGAQFWQMILPYRSFTYTPPPASGPNGPGFPFTGGWGDGGEGFGW